MHHVTLDGAGAHDGHFDHQIIVGFRFQAGQHVDLGPGFHLKYADAVAGLKHGVGVTVFLGNVLYPERLAFFFTDQLQRLSNGGEHAQGQHIHLHQPQALEIVLVPLDDGAIGHGGIFHRHQFGQWPGADHEPTYVLGEVPGKAQQGIDQGKELVRHLGIAGDFLVENLLAPVGGLVPPVDTFQQLFHQGRIKPQGLADIPNGALGPVADHGSRQGGTLTGIAPVDILDNLFAPFVLEIYVNVRGLVPVFGNKPLE